MATKKQPETEPETEPIIAIDRIATETLLVPILGTTPLIVHRFSEKAKRQMLDNMTGKKSPKAPKDPQAEYESSLYRLKDDEFGFPVLAFKAATIGGARFYDKSVTMTSLRQCIFMHGDIGEDGQLLAKIEGADPRMREDVVAVGRGTDLRYRAEFWPWSTTLKVTYVTSMLQRMSLLSLIDAGGLGVGIGEWRIEKKGVNGSYCVDPDKTVEVI